jgi:hypothetical protein
MNLVRPKYEDPFSPTLRSSEPLVVTDEQRHYIREILDIACSDSKFAQKAYDAIVLVLTGKSVTVPEVTSISPTSAKLGDPSFMLHVTGKGFTGESKIIWNGSEEPTTYVSATELTTNVDMSTAEVAMSIPVAVLSKDGIQSNSIPFELQPVSGPVTSAVREKELVHKKEEKHSPFPLTPETHAFDKREERK